MIFNGKRIILGSCSPRRRELLRELNIDFKVDTRINFRERFSPDTPPEQVPVLMAEGKSAGFYRSLRDNEILITADTMVILPPLDGRPGEILGKPRDSKDAARMLRDLSGREHHVITAVTIRSASRQDTFTTTTRVWFKSLSEEEIAYYIDNYRPYDKAGAYAIQEWIGHVGITRIDGSYSNVVGFPLQQLWEHLQTFLR